MQPPAPHVGPCRSKSHPPLPTPAHTYQKQVRLQQRAHARATVAAVSRAVLPWRLLMTGLARKLAASPPRLLRCRASSYAATTGGYLPAAVAASQQPPHPLQSPLHRPHHCCRQPSRRCRCCASCPALPLVPLTAAAAVAAAASWWWLSWWWLCWHQPQQLAQQQGEASKPNAHRPL